MCKNTTRPFCKECGGTNLQATAWIEWREDGTSRLADVEAPNDDAFCADCDQEVDFDWPAEMFTPAESNRRLAAEAAHEAGPELLAALKALLAGEAGADAKARELIDRLK